MESLGDSLESLGNSLESSGNPWKMVNVRNFDKNPLFQNILKKGSQNG